MDLDPPQELYTLLTTEPFLETHEVDGDFILAHGRNCVQLREVPPLSEHIPLMH